MPEQRSGSTPQPSPDHFRFPFFRTWRNRRARARQFGISAWDQVGYESAARYAYRELQRRDKRLLVVDFDGTPEPILMVFAKGERVETVRAALTAELEARRGR